MTAVDRGSQFCRIWRETETCRDGLNVAEHRLEHGRWRHPDGLDQRGYFAFGDEAVQ